MSYYVTVEHEGRRGFLAGPYRKHGDALAAVSATAEAASAVDGAAVWYSFGTARRRADHPAGTLNGRLGLPLDADGYVIVADPAPTVVDRRTSLYGRGPAPRGYVRCFRRRWGTDGCVASEASHYHPARSRSAA